MKLKRLELDGFGKLVKQTFEFSPGLNLIYGRNEVGKSTLQRSILAALYGFFDDGSITAAKKATVALFEPWDKRASFELKLIFEIEGGTQYRVERTFGPKAETALYDLKSGKSLNARFKAASQGRLFFAEELLGMPRDVFENTSLVRQAELVALEKSASAITDTLLRLSASASQESTASQALELLEITLKEQIGTQRSRNKPLPEEQRHLESLQAARNRLQEEHHALANKMHELAQAEESFIKLQRECDKAEYQLLLVQRLILQQQRQSIEQADTAVERCQELVSQYQVWSAFPVEARSKINRLNTLYEKATSDTRQAEQTAHRAQQRFPVLHSQLDNLRKVLSIGREIANLPDFETQPASRASAVFQKWLDEEFSNLGNLIQEQHKTLALTKQNLAGLNQIGHEGIAKYRQELGKLEADLAQAKQAAQQVQQSADQAGMPEDQWRTILSQAQTNAGKWQGWSQFPAHLRDELLQLEAQYTPLSENLSAKSQQISDENADLAQLQAQIEALQQHITSLENVRNVPHQEKPRIQEIASQLETAKQSVAETQGQFIEVDQVYQGELQVFELEKQAIEPLEQLGIAGLTQLQQRWLNASQQLASAQASFAQSQEAWNRVGMPIAELQDLENAVKDIQNGVRPTPKPRRGCRSLFMRDQAGTADQTPTEITIYTQIQPIYAEYIHQKEEISNKEIVVRLTEDRICQILRQLAPEVIQESTFDKFLQQIQDHQKKALQIERRKNLWDNRRIQFQQAKDRLQQVQDRLKNELRKFGFTEQNIEDALNRYFKACEQKERLISLEASLGRLESQVGIIKQQLAQSQAQQQSLAQTEGKIIKVLAKAEIQVGPGGLQEGLQRFEAGLESHRKWKEAQSQLEHIQTQVSELEEKLSKARSASVAREEKLLDFRQHLVKKFVGLLPGDFSDRHLAQLDADLQAYHADQSTMDKAQVQLEQLRLQAQTIQRDLSDWAEKEANAKRMENDILLAIQAAGIETNQISFSETLGRLEEAFQGFSQWQQAQRDYEAAVQAQQAVRTSMPKLETETANLETKITAITKKHPEWKNLTVSDKPEVYERKLVILREQVLQERDRLTRLKEVVDRDTKNLRHLAELDEEIDLVSAEVQRLVRISQALELASNELNIATSEFQKMFAPRLERIVASGLEQITEGRYRQVKIDPTSLTVHVLAPERDELVDAAQLSTGTRDLIYLVLRMGITQFMSSSGEKLPLLLDDPLVEFDDIRQQAALEYLKDLSGQTQILLFTKDSDVRDWFRESRLTPSQCNVIELR